MGVLENFQKLTEVPTINLVLYILEKGIKAHFYRLRGNILLDVLQKENIKHVFGDSYLVKCETDVNDLAARLFNLIPSFTEASICEEGRIIKKSKISTFSVDK